MAVYILINITIDILFSMSIVYRRKIKDRKKNTLQESSLEEYPVPINLTKSIQEDWMNSSNT